MNTSAFIKGLTADSYKWVWETKDELYKTLKPVYSRVAKVHPLSEITGSYFQTTSAIGISELDERDEETPIKAKSMTEGFTVIVKKRNYANLIPITYELARDWHRNGGKDIEAFLHGYVSDNALQIVERTRERAFATLIKNGGKTAGHAIFNNDTKTKSTGYGSLCYDSKPLFNLSGNLRTAKNGATYYNGLALTLSDTNLKTAHSLLTATNAKTEGGDEYDQTQNKYLMVPAQLAVDADVIVNSTLVSGSEYNDKNSLKGEYEIITNPFLNASPTAWVIGIKNQGVHMWIDKQPRIRYWIDEDVQLFKGAIITDLAIGVLNFRPLVGSNWPTA